MRRWLPILISLLLLTPYALQAKPAENQSITMNLPDAFIAEAMKRVLPLTLNGASSGLEGTITIVGITDFRVQNQQIQCHLDLLGKDLRLVTRVANQDIRLNLGTTRIDFDCAAAIRYDAARQTLFVRPTASGVRSANPLSSGDVGQALILLVNGREFPVALQNLKPVMAETSDKIITIRTKIVDVRAVEGALQLSLAPAVTTEHRQSAPVKSSGAQ